MDNQVVDKDGVHGRIVSPVQPTGDEEQVTVEVGDQHLTVPAHALKRQRKGYFLPLRFQDLDTAPDTQGESVTVPVHEERLQVDTRSYDHRVKVEKRVQTRDEWVEVPSTNEEITIERVAVNREVDAPTEAHYEGETLVVPVFEEVMVTDKRLVLREEVRITKRSTQSSHPEKVTLRREEVTVKRDDR